MVDAVNVPSTLDDIGRLKRFLCISDDLCSGIAGCVSHLANDEKGEEIVKILLELSSIANRKLVVGVLAMCTTKNLKTKQAAYEALNALCTTPPLLFHFLDSVAKQSTKGKSGFGRAKRKAIARWYNSRSLKDLAMFVTRYRRRSNWSHVDLVRLAHTKPGNPGVDFILKYVTKDLSAAKEHLSSEISDELSDIIKYLEAVEKVKHSNDEHEVARLVQDFQLSHEHVPTWFIKDSKEVWSALLPRMSFSSVLTHLNKMASIGLLNTDPGSALTAFKNHLETDDLVKESALNPLGIQLALKSYEVGKSGRSQVTWIPNSEVVGALQTLFYKAVALYEPTGGRYIVAIGVNPSMFTVNLMGAPVSSAWVAASLAVGILRKEANCHLLVPTGDGSAVPVDVVSRELTVEQLVTNLEQKRCDLGVLDFSKVAKWTEEKKEDVDTFVVFTDQHNSGRSLSDEFRKYCNETKRPSARLVIAVLNKVHDRNICGIQQLDPRVLILKGLNPAFQSIVRHFVAGKLDSRADG